VSRELGRLVEHRRHELGLSRRELAERSELSYPYISQIETGDRDPSLKTMHRLAEALELPVEQLAGLVSPESWLSSPSLDAMPAAAGMVAAAPASAEGRSRASAPSFDESVDLYREKVLPSIERRLQSIPPLMRLELLTELMRKAAREAAGDEQRDEARR
jgi:transcriptional regulator with XRE-family HTH domain